MNFNYLFAIVGASLMVMSPVYGGYTAARSGSQVSPALLARSAGLPDFTARSGDQNLQFQNSKDTFFKGDGQSFQNPKGSDGFFYKGDAFLPFQSSKGFDAFFYKGDAYFPFQSSKGFDGFFYKGDAFLPFQNPKGSDGFYYKGDAFLPYQNPKGSDTFFKGDTQNFQNTKGSVANFQNPQEAMPPQS